MRRLALLLVFCAASAHAQKVQKGTTALRLDAVDVKGATKGDFVFYGSLIDQYFKTISVTDAKQWKVHFDGEAREGTLTVKRLSESPRGVAVVTVIAAYEAFVDEPFLHARKGTTRLLNALRQQKDVSGIVTYGASVESSGGLVPGHNEAVEWLGDRKVAGVTLQVFEAIEKGLGLFPTNFDSIGPNRAMVVISDGFSEYDENPAELKDAMLKVRRMAESRNVRINVVGFAIEETDALEKLKKVAHSTGGTYREARTAPGIERYLDHFKDEVLGQHVLELKTSDFEGNKQTTFKLSVNHSGRDYMSGPTLALVPEKESHLGRWAAIFGGGALGLLLLFFLGRKILSLLGERGGDEVVASGPALRPCGGCKNQIPVDWKVCKYCEALPHLARLTVRTAGEHNGRVYFLKESLSNIGSAESNDVVLVEASVSKRHAGIKAQDGRFELADFGSTNGVLVNGGRIQKQFLKNGDLLSIGAVELEFSLK